MTSLSVTEIIRIHDRLIEQFGGSLGVREPGMLAAIAEKPFAGFGGEELYPAVYDKAAAIFEAICNYHVFVDGNKRTSIAVLEYFLYKNGYILTARQSQKELFTLKTATNNPDLADIAIWIRDHSKAVVK